MIHTLTSERLYNLLPVIYRRRDVDVGEPLRALMDVLERQFATLHANMGGLYDDWFIETCAEWVVPYIADLLGIQGMNTRPLASERAHVANAIAYRRRKGTVVALENVARDMTGWYTKATEMFQNMAATQNLGHQRAGLGGVVNLRDAEALAWLGSPFDHSARTADIRTRSWHHKSGDLVQASFNLATVQLAIWRLRCYPVTDGDACRVADGCYTFHPLGYPMHLFNLPATKLGRAPHASPLNVPDPLRPRALRDELEAMRESLANMRVPQTAFFNSQQPAFTITVNGEPIPPWEILIDDLSEHADGAWPVPVPRRQYPQRIGTALPTTMPFRIVVAVDPVLGRMSFSDPAQHRESVRVSYGYGFSADIGAGPYERRDTLGLDADGVWRALVARDTIDTSAIDKESAGLEQFGTLQAAVEAWRLKGCSGVITIMDSGTYVLPDALDLNLGAVQTVAARMAGSAVTAGAASGETGAATIASDPEVGGAPSRSLVIEAANGACPVIVGTLHVAGDADVCSLCLNGLTINGLITMSGYVKLSVLHCTLHPATDDGLCIEALASEHISLRVDVERSIVGPIRMPSSVGALLLRDSIVDGSVRGEAVVGLGLAGTGSPVGPRSLIHHCTVFGVVHAQALSASDSIFNHPVTVSNVQSGDMRFSYISEPSRTPRRYRCQPDLVLLSRAAAQGLERIDQLAEDDVLNVRLLIRPAYTSTLRTDAAFAQLRPECAPEITGGAENGGEMGALNHERFPYRLSNLKIAVAEYLPFGTTAGVQFVT